MGREPVSRNQLLVLAAGVAFALVPSLPFVAWDAAAFTRFHNWAIFVGGLLVGAALATARGGLDR